MFFFLSELYIVEASEEKSGNKVEVPNYEGKGGYNEFKISKMICKMKIHTYYTGWDTVKRESWATGYKVNFPPLLLQKSYPHLLKE